MEGNFPNSIQHIFQKLKSPVLFGQTPKKLISHFSISPRRMFLARRQLSSTRPCPYLKSFHLVAPSPRTSSPIYPGFKKEYKWEVFMGLAWRLFTLLLERTVVTWLCREGGREMNSSYVSKGKTGKSFQWLVLSATVSFSGFMYLHFFTLVSSPNSRQVLHSSQSSRTLSVAQSIHQIPVWFIMVWWPMH